nr:RNA-directed DNA polymerase, eukaryota, reverse transcriptase zinc-binding domain protein [Tanacetum cinerariifolium]
MDSLSAIQKRINVSIDVFPAIQMRNDSTERDNARSSSVGVVGSMLTSFDGETNFCDFWISSVVIVLYDSSRAFSAASLDFYADGIHTDGISDVDFLPLSIYLFLENKFGVSNWSSIVCELHLLKDKGFDFWSHCKKRIGDGHGTRFWYDIWIRDKPLRVLCSRLFALESDKDALVVVKMVAPVDHSFRRTVRDGLEQQQMSDMVSLLESVSLSTSQDRWISDLSGDGEFRVKVVRNLLDDMLLSSFSEPTRWVKCVPIKINIFA